MKKIPRTAKIGRGCRSSPIWLSEEFFEYIASQLLGIAQSYRILHGGEKIWISCLSGKSYISRVSAPQEHKIHIFELTCNVLFIIQNIFRRLLEIAEDYWRRPKKCFDHTPTKFSVVEGTKEKCYQTWYMYLHMWGYILFINSLPLGIPLTFI